MVLAETPVVIRGCGFALFLLMVACFETLDKRAHPI